MKRPAQHRELNMGQKKQTPGGCAASAPPGVCCFCPIHARPRIWTQADGGRLRNNELVQGAGVPTYRILEQVRASSTTLSAAMQSTGRRRWLSRPQISAWASSRTLLIKGETVCVCVCARSSGGMPWSIKTSAMKLRGTDGHSNAQYHNYAPHPHQPRHAHCAYRLPARFSCTISAASAAFCQGQKVRTVKL